MGSSTPHALPPVAPGFVAAPRRVWTKKRPPGCTPEVFGFRLYHALAGGSNSRSAVQRLVLETIAPPEDFVKPLSRGAAHNYAARRAEGPASRQPAAAAGGASPTPAPRRGGAKNPPAGRGQRRGGRQARAQRDQPPPEGGTTEAAAAERRPERSAPRGRRPPPGRRAEQSKADNGRPQRAEPEADKGATARGTEPPGAAAPGAARRGAGGGPTRAPGERGAAAARSRARRGGAEGPARAQPRRANGAAAGPEGGGGSGRRPGGGRHARAYRLKPGSAMARRARAGEGPADQPPSLRRPRGPGPRAARPVPGAAPAASIDNEWPLLRRCTLAGAGPRLRRARLRCAAGPRRAPRGPSRKKMPISGPFSQKSALFTV